jgi:hypothetical protein
MNTEHPFIHEKRCSTYKCKKINGDKIAYTYVKYLMEIMNPGKIDELSIFVSL